MWVDTPTLVGKHLTVRGFFVGDFDYRDKVVPVIREAAPLVADGALVVPVAGVYPLEHIQDAVQHLLRGGKILLKVAGRLTRAKRASSENNDTNLRLNPDDIV